MRLLRIGLAVFSLIAVAAAQQVRRQMPANQASVIRKQNNPGARAYLGFDRNDYPGDDVLPVLHRHFSFVGYWLNNPPGERVNTWLGKREMLRSQGFGFVVLFNGKLNAEIVKAKKAGTSSAALGREDAKLAIAAASREHFPAHTILFLDQEEGGRLLAEQAGYLLAWSETVARSDYRPGVYASGQPVNEGHGHTITTAQDIRDRVAAGHLHEITLWIAQDACPPSNGCTLQARTPALSGTPDAAVWQYAQSPRRKAITAACARTYAADGNCYAPDLGGVYLDLNVAASPDPSQGR